MPLTTHLVCTPETLPEDAYVAMWIIAEGQEVLADQPLLGLDIDGTLTYIHAPVTGIVTEHCVAVDDPITANELLALIDADEPDFAVDLLPQDDAAANLSAPACQQTWPAQPSASALPSSPAQGEVEALALCLAVGLNPDDIAAGPSGLQRRDVERHIRQELRTLSSIRDLLQRN